MCPAIVVFEGPVCLGGGAYEHLAKSQSQRDLRSRSSPTYTLNQNDYGTDFDPRLTIRLV